MSAKYTLASGTSTAQRLVSCDSCLIQLSDGTDVFIYFDTISNGYLLAYSSDHVTVNTIATVDTTTAFGAISAPLGFAITRDASDNLYIVGPDHTATNRLHAVAYKKGSGYSWTLAGSGLAGSVSSPYMLDSFAVVWCNTGGGTSGAGHLMLLIALGSSSAVSFYAICDAGAILANSGTLITATGNGGFLGAGQNPVSGCIALAQDGFGVSSGVSAVPNGSSALTVGSWSVTSSGVLSTNTALTGTMTVAGLSSSTMKLRVLRVSSNLFAVVAPTSGSSDLSVMRFSATAALDASPTPTGQSTAIGSPNPYLRWDAFVDPTATNRIWVITPLAPSGGSTQVVRIGCSVASGVTWDASVTNDDTLTALAFLPSNGDIRVVTQPTTANVTWQLGLETSSSGPTYALVGDYTPFASAPSTPTLQSPSNSSYLDAASGVTFAAVYNPTDGKSQNAYALRLKTTGAYSYWNANTSAWQSTIVWNAISTAPGGTFSVGPITAGISDGSTYNWSMASQESGANLQSGFASDFTFNAQAGPVLNVSGPGGSTPSAQPTITWTATPVAGASITNWQAKVFSAAQYSAGGFNPATSTPTWDSGLQTGNPDSAQVGVPLVNGVTYRFYVQVTETGSVTSDWIYSSATVVFDAPAPPLITATAGTDPTTGLPLIDLAIQGTDNILSAADASFESGVGSWVATTNCSIAQSTGESEDGSYSLAITATATGTAKCSTATGTGGYAVVAGQQYTGMGAFYAATTGRSVSVGIAWYNAAGTLLSTSTGSTVTDTTTGWTQAHVTANAPAGAAFATLVATITSAAASEVHYLDEAGIRPGSSATWYAGGFVGSTTVSVLRSDGLYVRGASVTTPLALPVSETVSTVDAEVTPYVAYSYAAMVSVTVSGGTVLVSAGTTSSNVTLDTYEWWEFDPTDLSTAVAAQVTQFNPQVTEQSAAHLVMGQQTPNVVANAMGLTDGAATFETFDSPTYAALTALLRSQKTIFLSSPFGESYYARFGPQSGGMSGGTGNKTKDAQLHPSTAAAPHHETSITFIAQPRPPV